MTKKVPAASIRPTGRGQSSSLRNWQKDALSIAFLYVSVLFLFSDYVVQNKVFTVGGDVSAGLSVTQAAEELIQKEGEYPLWFPYIFSGMPSHASGMYGDVSKIPVVRLHRYFNPFYYISGAVNLLFFNRDHSWEVATFFLAGVFMFVLARFLGFGRMIALVAAVSFMFCNFFVASVAAGHGGKVRTIAYIPLVVWTVLRFFGKRKTMNWSLMAFVMGLFFTDPGHTQIVYYGFLVVGIYCVYYGIDHFQSDRLGILKSGAGLGAAMLLGLGFGALTYFSQYVYSSVTMRTVPPAFAEAGETAAGSGMTFDYITNWSFHPLESVTFFIPTFFGLESPYYWGWMTFTSSAFYFGLLPVVAAVLAVIYRRRTLMVKVLLTAALLSWLISFGRFFEPFFKLMLAVLPYFDKFRVPSMILSIFAFSVCLLACYGLDFVFNPTDEERKKRDAVVKPLLYLLMAGVVLFLVFTLFKGALRDVFSYLNEGDAQRYNAQQVVQLKQIRYEMLVSGGAKFAAILAIAAAVLYFYIRQKLSAGLALSLLLAVLVVDTIHLNKKVLRPQNRTAQAAEFQMTETIRFLKSDTTRFRIFPLTEHAQSGSPVWTYFGLENIGGYSPTKMRIYQDIIDFALYKGSNKDFPINMNVVRMLNVKYLVAQGRIPEDLGFRLVHIDQNEKQLTYENPRMLPRAFFASEIRVESDRARLFQYLNSSEFDPALTALLEEPVDFQITPHDSSHIRIAEHRSNRIAMDVYVDRSSLLVLSEIYYPHGWNAYVDGQPTPIHKTDYILRSVFVPAGSHRVEFLLQPKEFTLGVWLGSACFFGVTALLVVTGISAAMKLRRPNSAPA